MKQEDIKLNHTTENSGGMINRRTAVLGGALAGASLMGARGAFAQAYPSKLITIVMPFAAGGSTDVIARVIAEKLRPLLGNINIVVENRAGGGGATGSATVARAAPDGYTLLLTPSGAVAIAPLSVEPIPFDPTKDFTPVAALHKYQLVLYSSGDGGYRSLDDVIAANKAGKPIRMAITGLGNSTHYSAFMLGKELKIEFVNVPYNAGGQAALSVMKGETDLCFLPAVDVLPQMESGAIRSLLITSKTPSSAFPNIPTLSKYGLNEPEIDVWTAIYGPRGLPDEVVTKVSNAVSAVYKSGEMDKYLAGCEKMSGTPQEITKVLTTDLAKYRRFMEVAGFKK